MDAKGNSLVQSMFTRGIHSIRQLSKSYAEQKSSYRFLENRRTTEESLIKGISNRCGLSVKDKLVLSIQDTTEINLHRHKNRIRQDGTIGVTNAAQNGLGFMLHPSLVVDAYSCFPYGYSHIHLYNREAERALPGQRDKNAYKQEPIEAKESNKWLSSCEATKATLQQAAGVIIIQDREGDIYEQFATVPDERTQLLIRAKSNRRLPEGDRLFDRMAEGEALGTYQFPVSADVRKKQAKRTATLEVRITEVVLQNTSRTAKNIAPTVTVYAVEAKEVGLKKAATPICWRLLTTLKITTLQEALLIIEWYTWRWMIEEVFRLLKKEGFDIEASELGYGASVRKLSLLILEAVLRIFQMRIAYEIDEAEGLPADMCFNKEEEIECLNAQCASLEGKTEKQKNPYKPGSLRYVTWVIARLGGWKGYTWEGKPGATILWLGLERFYAILDGWKSAIDVYTR